MKSKLNWGWGIALVYIFFAVATLAFVFFSRFHQMDLVTKDYYEKELTYEEQINRQKRAMSLENGLQWEFARAAKIIILTFPHDLLDQPITGNIMFFRPSDAAQDKIIPITLTDEGRQMVNVAHLSPGMWRMKIFWNVAEHEYYDEDILIID